MDNEDGYKALVSGIKEAVGKIDRTITIVAPKHHKAP